MSWFESQPGAGEQNVNVQLPLGCINQETNMWCWAASGEMVMRFQNVTIAQCTQANNRFGLSVCCQSPVPSQCVQGGWPEFDKYGFSFDRTLSAPLSWDQIVDQIGTQRLPFAFTWAWVGGGGHMMVIYGYAVADGVRYVHVHDPWPPGVGATRMLTYEAYVSGPNYTHWDDFYNVVLSFTPQGPGAMGNDVPGQQQAIHAATAEAEKAIGTMKKLIRANAPGTADSKMKLGLGIAVSFIRLDELQGVGSEEIGEANSNLKIFERPPGQVVFPVYGEGQTLGAEIIVSSIGKTWRQMGMGAPILTQKVQKAAQAPGSVPQTAAVLSVPSLNQLFLVRADDNDKTYIPLIDDPVLGFATTQILTGKQLLTKLTSAARHHNNLPR